MWPGPTLPASKSPGWATAIAPNRACSRPTPRGRTWWWIGAAGAAQDAGPGTDFHAVRGGCVSISPIHVDLTRMQALEPLARWVGGLAESLRVAAPGSTA
jgi:5'-nucleotidase